MRIGSKRKNLENLPISSLLVESTKKKTNSRYYIRTTSVIIIKKYNNGLIDIHRIVTNQLSAIIASQFNSSIIHKTSGFIVTTYSPAHIYI